MKSLLILSSVIAAPLFAASGGDLDANDSHGLLLASGCYHSNFNGFAAVSII